MYMYLFECVCAYVCLRVYVCVCLCSVFVSVYLSQHARVLRRVCVNVYVYASAFMCACVLSFICIFIPVCVCLCKYVCVGEDVGATSKDIIFAVDKPDKLDLFSILTKYVSIL